MPEAACGEFFPGIPPQEKKTSEYFGLEMASAEFWLAYGEPLRDFVRYALMFRRAIEELDGSKNLSGITPFLNFFFAALGQDISVSSSGSLEVRWEFASLVSLLVKMACLDRQGGISEHQCPGCGKPFISSAYNAKYCSARCASRDNKRKRPKAGSTFAG